jgi:uncharacterized membrane protein
MNTSEKTYSGAPLPPKSTPPLQTGSLDRQTGESLPTFPVNSDSQRQTDSDSRPQTATSRLRPNHGDSQRRFSHGDLRLRIKTMVMILAMVVCANAGDLMLKRGMTQIGAVPISVAGVTHAFALTVTNGTIWIGILFLSGFMLSYMTVLSWADYSYVMPAGAFGYALLTLLAVVFLHESVSPRRWSGVALICLGVLLVGQTRPSTTTVAVGEATD